MSDLISRKGVVNWLENYKFENYASVGHEKEYNFIENLIKGIQNEPTVEAKPVEWIPCSERLPSVENMDYLICKKDGIILMCMWSAGGFNTFKNLNGKYYTDAEIRDVVAWMPLPDPYNAERGGENEN